jgi:hypothetical protein
MKLSICVLGVLAVASALPCSASRAILTDFESPVPVFAAPQGAGPGCTVELSAEQSHSPTHSVKITYDYVDQPGIQYESLGTSLPLVGHVSAVSAWFLGNGSGLPVVLRVTDTGGEVHQFHWGRLDFTGWRELTAELKDPIVIYGGDGNRRIDWPIRLTQVIVDHGPQPAKGVAYVDDISTETDAPAGDFLTATVTGTEPGNVYVLGKRPAKLAIEVRNGSADTPVAGVVSVLLTGPGSQDSKARTVPCRLGPGGRLKLPEAEYRPGRAGLFRLSVALEADGKERTLAETRLCFLPDEGDSRLAPTSHFGVCTHFGQGKGRLPDSFQLMQRAGIKWLRDEWSWGGIEREKGVYTFPEAADRFFRAAKEYGITPLVIFDYGNPLYDNGAAPTSDEAQRAFGEYCYQLVNHYRDLCSHWEVYNEPNIGFWQPKPDPVAYARLLKIAYAACKRADPNCTVVGVCTAGTDLNYIRKVLENSGPQYLDALSIHPYRYPRSPEASNFLGEVTGAHSLLAEFGGGGKPVWLTEIGWPTHVGPGGVTEDVSGRMLVRMVTQALSLPFVGPIVWYDFQNDGLNEKYNEDNFGLIRWDDFSAKANYLAYRMVTRALVGKTFREQIRLPDGVQAYRFDAGPESAIVAWYAPPDEEKQQNPTQSVALKVGCAKVEVSGLSGDVQQVAVKDGTLPLTLTPSPIFIRGRLGEVRAAQAPLELRLDATADLPPGSVIAGSLQARGLSGQPVVLRAPDGWRVEPASWRPRSDDDHAAFRLSVPVTAESGSHAVKASCPASASGPVIETSVPLTVAEALAQTVSFAAKAEGLEVHWSVCNRASKELRGVAMPAGTPGAIHAPRLAPGACLDYRATVAPVAAGGTDVRCGVRFESADGVKREISFPVNVWRVPRASVRDAGDPGRDSPNMMQVSLPIVAEAVPIEYAFAPGRFAAIDDAKWSGPDDLSAKVGLMCDEGYLYLEADVTDDRNVQTETGPDVWQGDNIQFAVAFDPTRHFPPGGQPSATEIGLTLGPKGPEVYRWLPFGPAGKDGPLTGGAALTAVRRGTHTIYLASIPWSDLLPPPGWKLAAGQPTVLGFALIVNDNDGAGRKGWLQLFGGIGYGKDPGKYGLIILS